MNDQVTVQRVNNGYVVTRSYYKGEPYCMVCDTHICKTLAEVQKLLRETFTKK